MNLRFSEDSIRFRISRKELAVILQSGELSQTTRFPGGQSLTYRILISSENEIGLSLERRDDEILLFVPSFQLQDMLTRPPAKELGCYQDLPTEGQRVLRVALEVDLFTELKRPKSQSVSKMGKSS